MTTIAKVMISSSATRRTIFGGNDLQKAPINSVSVNNSTHVDKGRQGNDNFHPRVKNASTYVRRTVVGRGDKQIIGRVCVT